MMLHAHKLHLPGCGEGGGDVTPLSTGLNPALTLSINRMGGDVNVLAANPFDEAFEFLNADRE